MSAEALAERCRFLAEQPWVQGLSEAELHTLATLFVEQHCAPMEPIAIEGSQFGALCLVYRGLVAVQKRDLQATLGHVVLLDLPVGELFGEMSFLDGAPASATVRASEPTTILRLERNRLAEAGEPLASRLRERLLTFTAQAAVARLRAMDEALLKTRRSWKEEARRRKDLSRFLVVVVALFGLGNTVQQLIKPGLSPTMHMAYSWGFLLLIVALCAYFIRRQHAPLTDFGLTRQGFWRSAREGLFLGATLLATALLFRAIVRGPGEALLRWGSLTSYNHLELALFLMAYPFHCLLQEFVARGVIQSSVNRLAGDAHAMAGALVTALMFAIFHLHVSPAFAAATFFASLGFGLLYMRHNSLIGVTLTHYGVGMGSVFLGLN